MRYLMRLILTISLLVPSLLKAENTNYADNDDSFKNIAGELRCPTCTGLSVLDSDARFSVQIKDQVKQQMGEGKDKEQILDFFVERYGPWILREPPKDGFNAIAWAVPILMLFLGPLIVWAGVWRKKLTVSTFGVRSDDEIIEQMKTELQRLSKGG